MARKISFQKVLNVDSRKAFEVITNFNDYSDFIPGCTRATLISRELPIEIGRLEFKVLGKEYFHETLLINESIIFLEKLFAKCSGVIAFNKKGNS